jgi:hypothetical protein
VTNLPPGITVTTATTTPPRSSPTDTGTAFIPVLAPRAPAAPVLLTSMDAWLGAFDGPQSYSLAYTWADAFFRMGGNRLYAAAVFGAAAAKATATVAGSTSGTALTLTAVDLGDWANGSTGGLSYDIVNGASGGTFRVLVVKRAGVELARTAEASTIQGLVDAINAVTGTALVTATIGGGSGQPATATGVNLAGGSIDRGSVTQAQVDAALAKFNLGPGNIAAPDWGATVAAHGAARARRGPQPLRRPRPGRHDEQGDAAHDGRRAVRRRQRVLRRARRAVGHDPRPRPGSAAAPSPAPRCTAAARPAPTRSTAPTRRPPGRSACPATPPPSAPRSPATPSPASTTRATSTPPA